MGLFAPSLVPRWRQGSGPVGSELVGLRKCIGMGSGGTGGEWGWGLFRERAFGSGWLVWVVLETRISLGGEGL